MPLYCGSRPEGKTCLTNHGHGAMIGYDPMRKRANTRSSPASATFVMAHRLIKFASRHSRAMLNGDIPAQPRNRQLVNLSSTSEPSWDPGNCHGALRGRQDVLSFFLQATLRLWFESLWGDDANIAQSGLANVFDVVNVQATGCPFAHFLPWVESSRARMGHPGRDIGGLAGFCPLLFHILALYETV